MSQAKRVQVPREFLMPEAAMSTSPGPITVPPGAGHSFYFGGLGVERKIDGCLTDQLFAVVHHPLAARALGCPLHSPAGLENSFREVAVSWENRERFAEINQKYSLEMQFDSVPELCRRSV